MFLRAVPIVAPLCVRCLTHYEVLGIPRTATKSDVKKAFLEKAKECHPDLNPDEKAAVKFQEIQEAHDVLMNSKLRAQYNHQLNQETYYGSQQTHRSDNGPRRSKVRTHGVGNQYRGSTNQEFHENHRVNRDNYSHPGGQRDYYTDPSTSYMSSRLSDQKHLIYMLGLAVTGIFLYGVGVLVSGIKAEMNEGRHKKYKTVDTFTSNISSAPWPSDPVTNTVRVVWSEEKGKLIRADSIEGPGDLKKKFDDAMQSNLGEMGTGVEGAPQEKRPVTLSEISLLRIEMSKKKAEYLTAKKEYTDRLEMFNEEQQQRKAKSRRQEVV